MTTLSDLCQFIRGVSYDGGDATTISIPGKLPILRAGNIQGELDTKNDLVWVPASRVSHEQKLRKGDIAICMSSGSPEVVGKTALVKRDFNGSIGAFCGIIRPNAPEHRTYLSYFFQSEEFRKHRDLIARGANIQNLRFSQLENILIPLPSLSKQKHITELLDKANSLLRQRRYALELSNTYLQSVFLELFGDPVMNQSHWQIGQLFQLCNKIVDCPHATPVYSSNQTDYACIRSSDIQNGFLDWSTTKYISRSEFEKRIKVIVPMPKDVVYCREGARFGNAALISSGKQVCLGQRTMLFRADTNVATPEFIWAFLESESTKKQAIRLAGGSASPHLNVGDIKEFVTIIPHLPLQQKFAQIVVKFERLRAQQLEAECQAEHLLQTLLHQAFEGNVGLWSGTVQDEVGEDGVQHLVDDSQSTGYFVMFQMK